MPVLTRRQHMMSDTPRSSIDSSAQEHIWLVQDDYEEPQKEMDFPSASLHDKLSRHGFNINTYSKSDHHDRYLSSEEEPSPSPDSSDAESTHSEELKHKSTARVRAAEEAPTDPSSVESEAKTGIAVAMPIVAYGRPRLIDITNIAPMQRRIRTIKQPVAPSSTLNKQTMIRTPIPTKSEPNKLAIPNGAAEASVPLEKATEIARKQATMVANKRLREERTHPSRTPVSSAPDSWLPAEEEQNLLKEDVREYHFPSDDRDYEPRFRRPSTPRYSTFTTQKRNNSNPFIIVNNPSVGKGLARTRCIAKKGVVHHASISSISSSSAASHAPQKQQQHATLLPQTTYEPERQMTKKPKMIARGANEREESLVLPPCPFDMAA
ncbi:MAG: hypothetical protein Q9211_004034 [Gyalolechia sp. 1 TL-2023]